MQLYASYVRDFGGGFLMLGGEQSFGLGGYYHTPVEEMLPVRCDFEKEQENPSLGLVIVPIGLVFIEPDLGTSLSFLMIWATLVLVAGIRWRHAALLLAGAVVVSPLVWLGMKDYMRERLQTFLTTLLDPQHGAFDAAYNVLQAQISIGSIPLPCAASRPVIFLVPRRMNQ